MAEVTTPADAQADSPENASRTIICAAQKGYPDVNIHTITRQATLNPTTYEDTKPHPITLRLINSNGRPLAAHHLTLRSTTIPIIFFHAYTSPTGHITHWHNTQRDNTSPGSYVSSYGGELGAIQHMMEGNVPYTDDKEDLEWDFLRDLWEVGVFGHGNEVVEEGCQEKKWKVRFLVEKGTSVELKIMFDERGLVWCGEDVGELKEKVQDESEGEEEKMGVWEVLKMLHLLHVEGR